MNRIEKEIAKSINPEAAKELLDMFQKLSEMIYCAGWSANIEFYLWDATIKIKNSSSSSLENFKRYQVQEIIRLSELCQGWWFWKEPEGQTFVSLEEMKQLYESWKNSRPEVTPILEDDIGNPNGIMYKLRQIKI